MLSKNGKIILDFIITNDNCKSFIQENDWASVYEYIIWSEDTWEISDKDHLESYLEEIFGEAKILYRYLKHPISAYIVTNYDGDSLQCNGIGWIDFFTSMPDQHNLYFTTENDARRFCTHDGWPEVSYHEVSTSTGLVLPFKSEFNSFMVV